MRILNRPGPAEEIKFKTFNYTAIIITVLFLVPFLPSCSVFRTLGLYNTPPKYSETFEEITGKKFLAHSNKKDSLVLTLETTREEYSPYDEIELLVRISNTGSDTIYILEPQTYPIYIFYQELLIKDSTNKKINIWDRYYNIDYFVRQDDFGRKVEPVIASLNYKVLPGDSVLKVLKFITGRRLINNGLVQFSILKENCPGIYSASYTQAHEEYDEVKGPVFTNLNSPEIYFRVRDYTEKEIEIRNEAQKLLSSVYQYSDSLKGDLYNIDKLKIDSLFNEFKTNYPDNIYIPAFQQYLHDIYFHSRNKKQS